MSDVTAEMIARSKVWVATMANHGLDVTTRANAANTLRVIEHLERGGDLTPYLAAAASLVAAGKGIQDEKRTWIEDVLVTARALRAAAREVQP